MGSRLQSVRRRPRSPVLALAFAAAFALTGSRAEESPAASRYVEVAGWPDWSGWWAMDAPLSDEWQRHPPPLRSGYRAFLEARANDSDPDPRRYCRPAQFTGISGDYVAAIEFLFSPERVTIAGEDSFLRRIYLNPAIAFEAADDRNMGLSRGRWEGDTLVVETTHVIPSALFPGRRAGSQPIGEGVRIVERIARTDDDALRFEVTTYAPAVLTEPDHRIRTYHRVDKAFADEVTLCVDNDRSIDPVTGEQRFDLTPPPDLPPPPR